MVKFNKTPPQGFQSWCHPMRSQPSVKRAVLLRSSRPKAATAQVVDACSAGSPNHLTISTQRACHALSVRGQWTSWRCRCFLPLALASVGRRGQKTFILVYNGTPSHDALGLHPDLSALPFQESLHLLFSFFGPHSAPLILANHKVALPWPSWLAMWKNGIFSQSLHFEKSLFKEHAAERACAFVQSGQKNAALAVLKHSLQLGSQKNSPYG